MTAALSMSVPPQRMVSPERAAELKAASKDWLSIDLTPEQVGLLEMIVQGVLPESELKLELPETADAVALRDAEGVMLATLEVKTGSIEGVELPDHRQWSALRKSPTDTTEEKGRIAAFVSGPLFTTQVQQLVAKAAKDGSSVLLFIFESDPFSPFALRTRIRSLQAELSHFGSFQAELVLLPITLPDTLADREALFSHVAQAYGSKRYLNLTNGQNESDVSALHNALEMGEAIRDGLLAPAVEALLREACPPRSRQGFTVFFTGFSGSGKSTLARALVARLEELQARKITLLDGDLVRKNLSSELTFSKEHRNLNIRRIGFVANEITKNGGIAICAPIAPYDAIRQEVRQMIEPHGGFILVHVATPLEVCEARDRKGLYAKARAGQIKEFTGISDPYESPHDAALVLDTTGVSVRQAVDQIIAHLQEAGYLEKTQQ